MRNYTEELIDQISRKDSKTVAATIPYKLHVKVKALCDREECSVSDVIRAALQLMFKQLEEAEQ
jgi:Arc/MetJ-type ribon-helix-helix transcriptional regulator